MRGIEMIPFSKISVSLFNLKNKVNTLYKRLIDFFYRLLLQNVRCNFSTSLVKETLLNSENVLATFFCPIGRLSAGFSSGNF